MRLILPLFLSAFLVACPTDEDSPESCAYAVAQSLDAGLYDQALEYLDRRACVAAMPPEEREINRAAAYLGKGGYDIADMLLIVLQGDSDAVDADVRLLHGLTGLGARSGGLRNLSQAVQAYERMVDAFTGRLDEACLAANIMLLSPLQKDACFLSGLLAYARMARGFDLLLRDQLEAFLGLRPLDCGNDRNFSGAVDEGEITACALRARTRLDEGGGICRAAASRMGQPTGAVRWERVSGVPQLGFFERGTLFANLVPVRVTVEAGGTCPEGVEDLRLLQPLPGGSPQLVVSDGLCETETTTACNVLDSDAGCWPCPIPRAGFAGAVSVTETLLGPINVEAERWLAALPAEDSDKVAGELEELRDRFCQPAEGGSAECEEIEGDLVLTLPALREYLRQ